MSWLQSLAMPVSGNRITNIVQYGYIGPYPLMVNLLTTFGE